MHKLPLSICAALGLLACGGAPPPSSPLQDLLAPTAPADMQAPDLVPAPVPQRALLVTRSGLGAGVVTGDVGGIRCGDACSARLPEGTQVTLSVAVDDASSFTGWGGACAGKALRCSFTVTTDVAVVASFGRPSTCEEVRDSRETVADGAFRLFAGGKDDQPYDALCQFGGGKTAAYLILQQTMTGNFSQYTAGGGRTGNSVRTSFQRIRIDPGTLLVDISDRKYALSAGRVSGSGDTITEMDYATAADCRATNSSEGIGNVDLRGLPFQVAPDSFVVGGYTAAGRADYSSNGQVVNLRGGGFCGGIAPRTGPQAPFVLRLILSKALKL